LYVALSVKKALLSLQVIKTSFLLANGKFCSTKAKRFLFALSVNKTKLYLLTKVEITFFCFVIKTKFLLATKPLLIKLAYLYLACK
jgi:hypothetical protein